MTDAFTVEFLPSGVCGTSSGERSLLELSRSVGLTMESSCGGHGTCRSCAVRIEGEVPPPTAGESAVFTREELACGWRRACQCHPIGSCKVHVPPRTTGTQFSIAKDIAERVAIAEPILKRATDQFWYHGTQEVGPVADGGPFGLAVDLGTTNIAAALVDLCDGRVVGSATKTNPQVDCGADVIRRLEYAVRGESSARELQQAAVSAIAGLADGLTRGSPATIAEIAVVGNTVMQHMLLGLPIESLVHAPYEPAVLHALEIPASNIELPCAAGAVLYSAPNVAGFVGGDHLSALLNVAARYPNGRWAMLDIGTNTEIALWIDGEISCVSCASGPAFEGGSLVCGMRAAPGAVNRVAINYAVEIYTIGAQPPVGICGSGVLSLVASLKRAGLIDSRGRLQLAHPSIRERNSTREFVLGDDGMPSALPLVFTQSDLRAVQLAKGAIRTGLDILLGDAGMTARDLDRIVIAGAFGRFVDIEDAFTIGLLPEIPRDRVEQVGNSAGAGVCRLVACARARREVDDLAKRIRYIELATQPSFQKMFVARSWL
jgi:uncharacterized 2Fe-2S/4Fe-4S cluster protein (DUF4445 family)